MPPNFVRREAAHAIIDLTGDKDDDRPPVTRPNGTGRISTKRPGQSSSQSSKPSTPVNGSSSRQPHGQPGAHDSSPRRNLAKPSSGTSESAKAANSKSTISETTKVSQSLQSDKPFERSQKSSKAAGLREEVPQKPITEPILVLSDDGEDDFPRRPVQSALKRPRAFDTQTEKETKSSDPPHESSPNMSTTQLKRPRDHERQDEGAMPPKRQKLTQSFGAHRTTPASDSVSQGRSHLNSNDKTGQGRAHPSHNSSKSGAKDGQPRTTSSPSHKHQTSRLTPQDIKTDAFHQPTANQLSSSRDALDGASKSVPGQRQPNNIGSEPLRQRPAASKNATQDAEDDDDDRNSSGSGGQSSRRDTTPRIRRETAKAQALSAEKRSKTHSATNEQSPQEQDCAATTQLADRSKTDFLASRSQNPTPKIKPAAGADHPESRFPAKQLNVEPRQPENGKRAKNSKEPTPQSLSLDASAKAKQVSESRKESGLISPTGPKPSRSGTQRPGTPTTKKAADSESTESTQAFNQNSSEPEFSPLRTRRHEKAEVSGAKHAKLGPIAETGQKTPEARTRKPTGDAIPKASPAEGRKVAALSDEADLQLRSEAQRTEDQVSVTSASKNSFVRPTVAASAMRSSSSYSSQLPLGTRVEKVLGKYIDEMGDGNEYWTSVALSRARQWKEYNQSPECVLGTSYENDHDEKPTSFKNLRPLGMIALQKGHPTTKIDRLWGIERISLTGKGAGPTWMSANYSTFESNVPDVPSYAHYVSIKKNILAPNVAKLICWPYFGDDYEPSSLTSLRDQYHLDVDDRERKLVLLLKAQKYEEYVESALSDLECSWADVLRYLLEELPDVGDSTDAKEVLKHRDDHLEQDFSRHSDRWRSILTELPASSPEKLARTAVLCDNFQKLAGFSLWHIARKNELASLPDEETGHNQKPRSTDSNDLTCRICLRFNCPYHGELKERDRHESDDDSESLPDSVVATDIIHPPRVNYRTRVAIPPPYTTSENDTNTSRARMDRKDTRFWRKDDFLHQAHERGPFYPCHHPGTSCADAQCSCFENRLPCEKICSCAPDCPRKFQGCSCSTARFKKGTKGPCFEDERCVCYQLGRECDPDLCGDCGACEVADPVNKYNDDIINGRCRNCSIQRGVPKHTLLGDSGVHGLGLYACEDICEHDFVGEYKGEIITKAEAERRGAVYEIQKLSYLFSLNATQEIDSTNFGNKIRFINHNGKGKANLYPRIIMVNTVHRIALYASNSIRPGQELFFDYGPMFPEDQLGGGKKSKKSAPHVRNAELVRNFLDVEESEDEVGNIRAKGVAHASHARNKRGGKKARGGARPNAGRKKKAHDGENASAKAYRQQDAGERLAAYNVSDEIRSDAMDVDIEPGAEEDEEYEDDDGSDSAEYYENESSERSDSEEYDEDDD